MVWNDARTSVGNRWGSGPARVNGIPVEGSACRFASSKCGCWDSRGQPQTAVPVRVDGRISRFAIGPEHRTLWASTKSGDRAAAAAQAFHT